MPLSWNEIKDRALRFSREWKGEGSERAEAQSFWNGFFDIFGIDRRRVAIFEKQVEITRAGRKLKRGRIDAFWKGVLLIEHKSDGQDLERAFAQASDYFDGVDDGHFLLTVTEARELAAQCPATREWIRPFVWGEGYIRGEQKFCLWLAEASPTAIRRCPEVLARVERVRRFRESSNRLATKVLASTPGRFGEIRQPLADYIFIPKTSSERRAYVPMGFLSAKYILNNTSLAIEGATLLHFGVISSAMHMAWFRSVSRRLKSDYRYSNQIVYNNFPWPENPTVAQKQKIETAAQGVLDARAAHPNASLADLYDPLTMPPNLVKAQQVLDAAVDGAYGRKGFKNDAERVAFLFELYQKLSLIHI